MTSPTDALRPDPAWGRRTQHTRVKAMQPRLEPNEALDRCLVAERIHRYAWGYDERDADLLADCFTADAVWEGSIMGTEPVGPFHGREALIEFLTDFWTVQRDQRRHIFSNVVIDHIDTDTATAHAYLMLTSASDASMQPQTTGPYRFDLVNADGVWRIKRLSAGFDAPF